MKRDSQIMWALDDVVGLFSINVGPFSRNVGRSQPIFSAIVGPNRPMLSGRPVYVLGSPQVPVDEPAANAAAGTIRTHKAANARVLIPFMILTSIV
jgi:hypothetical protein